MGYRTSTKASLERFLGPAGVASRSEFWWFSALLATAYLALIEFRSWPALLPLTATSTLPWIMVGIRRCHDAGRPAWHMLAGMDLPSFSRRVGMASVMAARATDLSGLPVARRPPGL